MRKSITAIVFLLAGLVAQAQKITSKDTMITVQDTIVSNIVNKVEKYSFTLKQTRNNISQKINIKPLVESVMPLQKSVMGMQNILDSSGRFMNLFRLNTFAIMLDEFEDDLSDYKQTLTDYSQQLRTSNDTITKIEKDSSLDILILDTVLEKQIMDLRRQAGRLDTMQRNTIAKVTILRNKVSLSLLQVKGMSSIIDFRTKRLKRKMWSKEVLPLFQDRSDNYSSSSIFSLIGSSLSRSLLVSNIYISKQWDVLTIAILVFALIIIWTWSNMRNAKKLPESDSILAQMYFLRPNTVILCGLLVFFIFLPFFFGEPPISVIHICEVFRTIIITVLFYPYLTKPAKRLWLIFCATWLFFIIDDLLLDSRLSERWLLFFASVIYALLCIKILTNKRDLTAKISASKVIKGLTIFCLLQILFAVFFNITGRITLTKIFCVSAAECLMLGITLKVFCSLVLEAIFLQSETYQKSRLAEYINYKHLENKFRRGLWILASLIWIISLIRDWGMYSSLIDSIGHFFYKPRTIGSHHFSFGNIALFIGIIWISVIVSSIINFFFGQSDGASPTNRKSIASMMLLIRLAIWAVGFLIAVAAASIPLNQLTVMLGALGVGIGFGLQNIANNLVSGVILAFERPIQVGDQIEIGGKTGKVKEIGVRSSKLSGGNGADIIIPNGDLLSQQLTNWTMKDLTKSVEFTIGISYESGDIIAVKNIIADTLSKEEDVLATPAPSILLQTFADAALEIKISFWVMNLSNANAIRSNVMIDVYKTLQENNVKLPYPIIRQEKKKENNEEG
ncbi:MAG: mechanosensitive ion channel [Arachidicoccus sp.]|nr:mechanosensitive ion channel [Arachidicoccus sp.]